MMCIGDQLMYKDSLSFSLGIIYTINIVIIEGKQWSPSSNLHSDLQCMWHGNYIMTISKVAA